MNGERSTAFDSPGFHSPDRDETIRWRGNCSHFVRGGLDIMKIEPIREASRSSRQPDLCVSSVSRRVLCVFPRYTKSFGTFDNAYPLLGVKAFMPPQGLLVIAAYLPAHWEVRFVDENVRPAREKDFRWADAVLVSGMHIQRQQINDINRRAHQFGKVTALGGPSVSGCQEYYPDFDYLH